MQAATASNLLRMSLPLGATNVFLLQFIIGDMGGYNHAAPCKTTIWTDMPAPLLSFMEEKKNKTNGLEVFNFTTRWECQKTKENPELYQIVDLFWRLSLTFNFYINDNMTTYIHIHNFNLHPEGYTNNTLHINEFTFKTIYLPFVNLFAAGIINAPFKHGPVALECPLKNHCLGLLYFEFLNIYLTQEYAGVGITPSYRRFNKGDTPPDPNCSCPTGATFKDFVLPYFLKFG